MRYVVWDWNGTLLDDAPLCVEIMDRMLRKRGLAAVRLTGMDGDGMRGEILREEER